MTLVKSLSTVIFLTVLRIGIRCFFTFRSGYGIWKKFFPDSSLDLGSRVQPMSLVTIFWITNTYFLCVEVPDPIYDQGHFHSKLEVPAENRTRASTVGGKHSRKELFEQLVNSYSEHLQMSARPVKNDNDSIF